MRQKVPKLLTIDENRHKCEAAQWVNVLPADTFLIGK
jgi:hypothetical protein